LNVSEESEISPSASSQARKWQRKSEGVIADLTPSEKRKQHASDKKFETGKC